MNFSIAPTPGTEKERKIVNKQDFLQLQVFQSRGIMIKEHYVHQKS